MSLSFEQRPPQSTVEGSDRKFRHAALFGGMDAADVRCLLGRDGLNRNRPVFPEDLAFWVSATPHDEFDAKRDAHVDEGVVHALYASLILKTFSLDVPSKR